MRSSTRDLRASASGRFVGLESLLVEGVRLEPLFGTADLRVRREDMVVGGGRVVSAARLISGYHDALRFSLLARLLCCFK